MQVTRVCTYVPRAEYVTLDMFLSRGISLSVTHE